MTMSKTEREIAREQVQHYRTIEAINHFAVREGWGLFNDGEIQRIDSPDGPPEPAEPPFLGDDDAIEHVRQLAEAGSALHVAALAIHKAAEAEAQETDA